MTFDKCPTCGAEVTVVGKTTLHYEPVYNSENWNLLVRAKLAADDEVKSLKKVLQMIYDKSSQWEIEYEQIEEMARIALGIKK